MTRTRKKPIHPGEVLSEVYLKPSTPKLTVEAVSRQSGLSRRQILDLIRGHRTITPPIAVRLSSICHTTPGYWLSLQHSYDRELRRSRRVSRPSLQPKQPPDTAAA